ncbi:IS630 transposase-related protein, partial [Streptococcus pneumoniae]|nr:IS630 transposase-related protein [Streptococcus pneumoniae]
MAYSIDFRKKVLSYCERTGSITEASHVFQISRNTIYGWLKLKEKTGELNHQVKGTKPRKVDRDRLKPQLFTPNLKIIQNPCLSLDPGWFLFSPNGCFLLDK